MEPESLSLIPLAGFMLATGVLVLFKQRQAAVICFFFALVSTSFIID